MVVEILPPSFDSQVMCCPAPTLRRDFFDISQHQTCPTFWSSLLTGATITRFIQTCKDVGSTDTNSGTRRRAIHKIIVLWLASNARLDAVRTIDSGPLRESHGAGYSLLAWYDICQGTASPGLHEKYGGTGSFCSGGEETIAGMWAARSQWLRWSDSARNRLAEKITGRSAYRVVPMQSFYNPANPTTYRSPHGTSIARGEFEAGVLA